MPRARRDGSSCDRCSDLHKPCSHTQPCHRCVDDGAECSYSSGMRLNLGGTSMKRKQPRSIAPSLSGGQRRTSVSQTPSSARSRRYNADSAMATRSHSPAPMVERQRPSLDELVAAADVARENGGPATSSSEPLVAPFFRFFGPTAIAPGLRYIDAEIDPDDPDSDGTATGRNDEFSPPNAAYATIKDVAAVAPSPVAPASIPTPDSRSHCSDRPLSSSQHLFDPRRPNIPRRDILEHLVPLAISHLGCHLPFLSRRLILDEPADPLMVNCACALAARFSDHPELVALRRPAPDNMVYRSSSKVAEAAFFSERSRGQNAEPMLLYESANPFAEAAKNLLVPLLSLPSLQVIQGLVCLTWIEWGSNRDAGAWMLGGMCIRMSQDLGLLYREASATLPDPMDQLAHKLTFWSVYFIDRIQAYGGGRRVAMHEDDIDIDLPTGEDIWRFKHESTVANNRTNGDDDDHCHPWPYLIALLRYRGKLSDMLNVRRADSTVDSANVSRLVEDLTGLYANLPVCITFSPQNLLRSLTLEQSPVFIMIHCLFHSLLAVLHRPALLQGALSWPVIASTSGICGVMSRDICLSSCRTISDILSFTQWHGPAALDANPFLDHSLYIAALALLDEVGDLRSQSLGSFSLEGITSPARIAMQALQQRELASLVRLDVVHQALEQLSCYWGGVAWVSTSLRAKREEMHIDAAPRPFELGGERMLKYRSASARIRPHLAAFLAERQKRYHQKQLPEPLPNPAGELEMLDIENLLELCQDMWASPDSFST